jgi:hypothetical protein
MERYGCTYFAQQPPQQILGRVAQVSSSQSAIHRVCRPNGSAATMPTTERTTARMDRLNFILVWELIVCCSEVYRVLHPVCSMPLFESVCESGARSQSEASTGQAHSSIVPKRHHRRTTSFPFCRNLLLELDNETFRHSLH